MNETPEQYVSNKIVINSETVYLTVPITIDNIERHKLINHNVMVKIIKTIETPKGLFGLVGIVQDAVCEPPEQRKAKLEAESALLTEELKKRAAELAEIATSTAELRNAKYS